MSIYLGFCKTGTNDDGSGNSPSITATLIPVSARDQLYPRVAHL